MVVLILFPTQTRTTQEVVLKSNSELVVLGNSVDMGLAHDFLEELRHLGFSVMSLHPSEFSTQRMASLILILGGPDAYEGTGGIVKSLLNSSITSAVRKEGASFLLELRDVWREGQTVLIAMGSDRNSTRDAYQRGYDRILSTAAPRLELSGEVRMKGRIIASSVELGPEAVVHLDGDTMLISLGPLEITGVIRGECMALALLSSSNLTLRGEIDNSCPSSSLGAIPSNYSTEDSISPGILLWGTGDVIIEGNITSSGEIMVSNGPNPTEISKRIENNQTIRGASHIPPGKDNKPKWLPWVPPNPVVKQRKLNFVIIKNSRFIQRDKGGCVWQRIYRPKKTWVLSTWGDIYLKNSYFRSRGGRNGCNRTANGEVEAGNGEHGVGLSILVEGFELGLGPKGNLVVETTTFRTGDGGRGGYAVASPGSDGGARARGGRGGWGGAFLIDVDGHLEFKGASRVILGEGGRGGDARAWGADGRDGCPGHKGGDAVAEAGDGGGGFYRLTVSDFAGPIPSINGGTAGDGGNAEALPGNGGNGNATSCDGGVGGNARATAGKGGNSVLLSPNTIAPTSGFEGGDGGNISVSGGNGGNGGTGCIYESETFKKGGKGGRGGNVTARSGDHGIGTMRNGKDGTARVESASNGGNGGDGNPPGLGGLPGAMDITDPSGRTFINNSFNQGRPGNPCLGFVGPDSDELLGLVFKKVALGPGTLLRTRLSSSDPSASRLLRCSPVCLAGNLPSPL